MDSQNTCRREKSTISRLSPREDFSERLPEESPGQRSIASWLCSAGCSSLLNGSTGSRSFRIFRSTKSPRPVRDSWNARILKLRAEMPERLHPALTFCYETGGRIGAMKQVIWPWVNLAKHEISFPPGIVKNRKPLIVPLSDELLAMLKKKFQGVGPVFEVETFRREWIKACVKCEPGVKTGNARLNAGVDQTADRRKIRPPR